MSEENQWTEAQTNLFGECHYCGEEQRVRMEPFGGKDACKSCWEQICYGEDD